MFACSNNSPDQSTSDVLYQFFMGRYLQNTSVLILAVRLLSDRAFHLVAQWVHGVQYKYSCAHGAAGAIINGDWRVAFDVHRSGRVYSAYLRYFDATHLDHPDYDSSVVCGLFGAQQGLVRPGLLSSYNLRLLAGHHLRHDCCLRSGAARFSRFARRRASPGPDARSLTR